VKALEEEEDNLVPLSEIIRSEMDFAMEGLRYVAKSRANASTVTDSFLQARRGKTMKFLLPTNVVHNAGWIYLAINKGRIQRNIRAYYEKFFELKARHVARDEAETELQEIAGRDWVSTMLLPHLFRADDSYTLCITKLRGTRLRAAVELYQRRHGRFPEDLGSLVSDNILEEIPLDPYSEKPFGYSDNIVYSVGPDREDGKGTVPLTPPYGAPQTPGDFVF
jgi:hypothetical protein